MTELETLMRAKLYIEKLANGIDPISDTECPRDSVLNQVRLSRCFFYVAQILDKVIDNGGVVHARPAARLQSFQLTAEQKSKITILSEPVPVSVIVNNINAVINQAVMKKISVPKVTGWLLAEGILRQVTDKEGRNTKVPADTAASLGITCENRTSAFGQEYTINLYAEAAQRFIIDHLEEIAGSG